MESGPPGDNGHQMPLLENGSDEKESSATQLADPILDKASTFYYLDWPDTYVYPAQKWRDIAA